MKDVNAPPGKMHLQGVFLFFSEQSNLFGKKQKTKTTDFSMKVPKPSDSFQRIAEDEDNFSFVFSKGGLFLLLLQTSKEGP